jgi:hypothetical protein
MALALNTSSYSKAEKVSTNLLYVSFKVTVTADETERHYYALSNCDATCGGTGTQKSFCSGSLFTNASYHFTNGPEGDANREYTAEDMGLLEVNITFFALYCLLFLVFFYLRIHMLQTRKYFVTLQILGASVLVMCGRYMFGMIYYSLYGQSGYQTQSILIFGLFLGICANTFLQFYILGIGSGWTIWRRKVPVKARVRMTIGLTLYFMVSVAALLWTVVDQPHMNEVMFYESGAGIMSMLILVFMGLRFLVLTYSMAIKFPDHARFLNILRFCAGVYFFHLPFVVALSQGLEFYNRPLVLESFHSSVLFLVQTALMYAFNPRASFFPFHAFASDMVREGNKEKPPEAWKLWNGAEMVERWAASAQNMRLPNLPSLPRVPGMPRRRRRGRSNGNNNGNNGTGDSPSQRQSGQRLEGGGVESGDENKSGDDGAGDGEHRGEVSGVVSFSGGSQAPVDKEGRLRVLNTFDQLHVRRVKNLSIEVNKRIQALAEVQEKLDGLLENTVVPENVWGGASAWERNRESGSGSQTPGSRGGGDPEDEQTVRRVPGRRTPSGSPVPPGSPPKGHSQEETDVFRPKGDSESPVLRRDDEEYQSDAHWKQSRREEEARRARMRSSRGSESDEDEEAY